MVLRTRGVRRHGRAGTGTVLATPVAMVLRTHGVRRHGRAGTGTVLATAVAMAGGGAV